MQNEYSEFKAICEAESIKYRADFANGFYWVMQHFMFNVSHVLDSNAYDFMKQEIKEIAQVRNAEELNFFNDSRTDHKRGSGTARDCRQDRN